ncbi:hypothetical protein SMD44_00581 [Streptomyces alboflavus]|uniref:Uncharacterized protein n=1 Tax=Streptomyces alboflavus TaxID=67267 RepID=A0A1Z1W431_9ACTN|nr:hypothetical protein SMD44_00581 [Streptomyces alboflavus]
MGLQCLVQPPRRTGRRTRRLATRAALEIEQPRQPLIRTARVDDLAGEDLKGLPAGSGVVQGTVKKWSTVE